MMPDGQNPRHLLSAAFDVLANVPLPPPDLRHAFVENSPIGFKTPSSRFAGRSTQPAPLHPEPRGPAPAAA
jgi:hypothetical protein